MHPHVVKDQMGLSSPARKRPGKLFRRFRRTVRFLFIAAFVLALLIVVVTQGPVAQWLMARVVRNATGGVFTSGWVSVKLDGRLVVSKPLLRSPTIPGDAGMIASAESIEVDLDWTGWAALTVVPTDVRLHKPVLRLSVDRADNTVNLASLGVTKKTVGTGGASSKLPRLSVGDGVIIIGEHDHSTGGVTTLSTFDASGWLAPLYRSDRVQAVLRTRSPDDPGVAVDVQGWMNLVTSEGELTADGIDLSRWGPSRIPTSARDLWTTLRLRGRIDRTELRYTRSTGVEATLRLKDVSMRAPIAAGRAEITGTRNPVMEDVSGYLRFTTGGAGEGLQAELRGLFEDLPAKVRLESRGLALDAPYRAVVIADKFELDKDPRILWFTPEVVQRNFDRFSGPTATIDARIEVSRAEGEKPGEAGETNIAGTMIFRDADAAYEVFPYPMHALAGTLRFDDDKVELIGVQGRGPSGARIFAEGKLDPPTGGSRIDVTVTATDVPMDEHLWRTLEKSRAKPIIEAAFNAGALASLESKGFVNRGNAPFAFDGHIDAMTVHVTSPFGKGQPLNQRIDVHFDRVALLPKAFPYPMLGTNSVVRIDNDTCRIVGDEFRGVTGGHAAIDARVDFVKNPDKTTSYRPVVRVRARDLPIDELLLNAIPVSTGDAAFSVNALLESLHVSGGVGGEVRFVADDKDPDGRLTASLSLDGLRAAPSPTAGNTPITIEKLAGGIEIAEHAITFTDARGTFTSDGAEGGVFAVTGTYPRDERTPINLSIAVTNVDTGLAIEDVVRPIVPAAAKVIEEVKAERKPSGAIDASFTLGPSGASGTGRMPWVLTGALTGSRGLSLLIDGRRVGIANQSGQLDLRAVMPRGDAPMPPSPLRLALRDFRADLSLDGHAVGTVNATGVIAPPTDSSPMLVYEPLTASLRGVPLDGPVAREAIARFGGASLAASIIDLDPAGIIDGEIKLTPSDPTDARSWTSWIAVRPEWLAFNKGKGGGRVTLPMMSGQITVAGSKGTIEELTVVDDDWNARFNGTWIHADGTASPSGNPWIIHGRFDLDVLNISPSLLSLLPESARDALTDAKLVVYGGLEAPDISVDVTVQPMPDGPSRVEYDIKGRVTARGVFADPGVSVTNANAAIDLRAMRNGTTPASLTLALEVPTLRLAGLRITDAKGVLRVTGADGEPRLEVPSLIGNSYGGRFNLTALAARALNSEPKGNEQLPLGYEAKLQLAGVRFADILTDLQRTTGEGPPMPDDLVLAESDLPPDYSRGMVEADLAVSGALSDPVTGAPGSRRGRGAVRIAGGRAVLDLPVVYNMLQLSHLQLPSGDTFDFAYGDFYLNGPVFNFEHIALISDPIVVLGAGQLNADAPGGGIDLRFVSRAAGSETGGALRIPILTDIFEGVRDQFVTTRVKGTIRKPETKVEPFFGLRKLLEGDANLLHEAGRVDLEALQRDRLRTLGLVNHTKK